MNGNRRTLLVWIAVAFALGLAAGHPLAAVALLPVTVNRRARGLRVLLLAFAAGAVLPSEPPKSPLLAAFPEGARLVRLTGTVDTGPDLPRQGVSRLDLDVEAVADVSLSGRARILLSDGSPLPSPGAKVEFIGRLLRPRPAGNPGEMDGRARLQSMDITHLGTGGTHRAITVLAPAPALSPKRLLHRARVGFERRIHSVTDPETAAMLSCLLLGRRDRVPETVERDFRRSGTVHFLAISGLHVGILAGLLWFALHLVSMPRRPAALVVAIATLSFAALTGMRPPVARASLLVVLVAAAVVLRRPVRPFHLLAAAAVVILVSTPDALGSPGFVLSFTAVISIVLLAKKLEDGLFERWILLEQFSVPRSSPLHFVRSYVRKSVPVSLAAWLGTGPIVLHVFGTVSLLVVPANLLVLPFIAALLPAGLLAVLTGFDAPASLLASLLKALVGLLADVPCSSFALPPPSPVAIVLHYCLLILASRRPRLGRRWALGLLLSFFAVAATGPLLRSAPAESRLTVLSVGHGLAAVLETREGGVLVYDAGSARPRIFDRVVLPYLREKRIAYADAFVLSHMDQDHISGAAALLDWMPVSRTHLPRSLESGDRLDVPGATAVVLWPPAGFAGSRNNGSTVVRIRSGGLTALLTGDIEETAIRELLTSGLDLRADVLIAPHHGRPEPGAAELLRAVRPKVVIASASKGEPLDPAYRDGLHTGERGAVTVYPNGRVETFR